MSANMRRADVLNQPFLSGALTSRDLMSLSEHRLGWIPVVTAIREYVEALHANGQPAPQRLYARPDGQWVADVFPAKLEAMLYGGFRGEVWIQPGKQPTQVGMSLSSVMSR